MMKKQQKELDKKTLTLILFDWMLLVCVRMKAW